MVICNVPTKIQEAKNIVAKELRYRLSKRTNKMRMISENIDKDSMNSLGKKLKDEDNTITY